MSMRKGFINFSVKNIAGFALGAIIGWTVGGFFHLNVGFLILSVDLAQVVAAFIGAMVGDRYIHIHA